MKRLHTCSTGKMPVGPTAKMAVLLLALTFAGCRVNEPSSHPATPPRPRETSGLLRGKHRPHPTPTPTPPTTGNAQISWQPLTGASGYQVYWGQGTNKYANKLSVTDTSATVTGLSVGTTYYFSVAGIDSSGIPGARSTPVALTVKVGLNAVEVR